MIKLVDWCHSEELEIRSLCDLELVKVTSLMMILRDFESWPSLHDKLLAAALKAVINNFQNQKKKQGVPGALAHILKGFRSGKANNIIYFHDDFKSGFGNRDMILSISGSA
nr:synaptobrevin, WD40/YVTN repeat-like-containing domain protein [Tanacetum cinerariifolium]